MFWYNQSFVRLCLFNRTSTVSQVSHVAHGSLVFYGIHVVYSIFYEEAQSNQSHVMYTK